MDEGSDDAHKGGERIAQDIEHRIRIGALQGGHALGTMESLADHYGVSRWVVREAIAIAEMDGLVRSRRGTNGGLVVAAPSEDVRVSSVRHFFILAGVSGKQINDMRRLVEGLALQRAMHRMTGEQALALRDIAKEPVPERADRASAKTSAFFERLLELADHKCLTLFAKATAQANIDRLLWQGADIDVVRGLSQRTWELRNEQIEALIGHDLPMVLRREDDIHAAGVALHAAYCSPPADLASAIERTSILSRDYMVSEGGRSAKKPEALARLMAEAIRSEGLAEGERLGFEGALMERFGVSRNVMREAVRMLERYGIVVAKRGQHGGLRARRPDPEWLVCGTETYLAGDMASSPESYASILRELLFAAIDAALATDSARCAAGAEEHRAALAESCPTRSERVFTRHYDFLGRAAENPALEMFISTLTRSSALVDRFASPAVVARTTLAQRELARAVAEGDRMLARRYVVELARAFRSSSDGSGKPVML